MVTSVYSSWGRWPSRRNATVCLRNFESFRSGKSRRACAPLDSSRARAEAAITCEHSSMQSSSRAAMISALKRRLVANGADPFLAALLLEMLALDPARLIPEHRIDRIRGHGFGGARVVSRGS